MSIAEFLKNIRKENVSFSKHALETIQERKLEPDFILEKFFDFENLEAEARQNGTAILVYRHSSKYHLVIIISAESGSVRIVTAFKSSKKIEKLLKRAKAIISYNRIIPVVING